MRQSSLQGFTISFLLLVLSITTANAQETLSSSLAKNQLSTQVLESGQAAGQVVELRLRNHTPNPLELHIPTGTVLVPEDGQQARMVSSPAQVQIPANGTATVPLEGVCVEYGAPVPTAGTVSDGYKFFHPNELASAQAAGLDPGRFSEPVLNDLSHCARVIETAQDLYNQGKFHNDLGPKHLMTVTQRAVWNHLERASEVPHDREKIWTDIDQAVTDNGGKQTPEQVDQLADNLWADVSLVTKNTPAQTQTGPRHVAGQSFSSTINASNKPKFGKDGWTYFGGRHMRWIVGDISVEKHKLEDDTLEKIRDEILDRASAYLGKIPVVSTVKTALENSLSADASTIYVTWLLVDEHGNVLTQYVDVIHLNGDRGDAVAFLGKGDKKGQEDALKRQRRKRDDWLKKQRNNGARVVNNRLVPATT